MVVLRWQVVLLFQTYLCGLTHSSVWSVISVHNFTRSLKRDNWNVTRVCVQHPVAGSTHRRSRSWNNFVLTRSTTHYTPWAIKIRDTFLLSIYSPIIDRFLEFFYWRTLQTICNNVLFIPPHGKCVSTLPCEISIKAKINDNNKNLSIWKTFQTSIAINDLYDTSCVRPTQFSVIRTIHWNVGLKCFFWILPKCLLFYYRYVKGLCIFYWYFTR